MWRRNPDPVVEGLQNLLSDTYLLYIKTQNFHWNVTGPDFGALHTLFQTQYTELSLAVDLIAERIRALGGYAAGSCADFTKYSSLHENTIDSVSRSPNQLMMIEQLAADNEAIAEEARKFIEKVNEVGDESTSNMIADRITAHDKAAWMLKSHLS